MQKSQPKFSALGSAVINKRNNPSRTWKSVFVQSKSVNTQLNAGTKFLYCECLIHQSYNYSRYLIPTSLCYIGACSELVTAYTEEYNVRKGCKESEFVKCNIPGYRTEWIRYGYFEFNKPAYIKPHQKVIVKKKVGCMYTNNQL